MRFLKLLGAMTQAGGTALSALWTFPSMLLSAFLVAWGAEAAQFLISQGLALALLAWLQTLPEFAVEAVIAWDAGRTPERAHLAIANLTGAIRLLLGLGWPMIYFVFAFSARRRGEAGWPTIRLKPQHAIEVVGLVPPLLYFVVIVMKQSIGWIDAIVLLLLYLAYLYTLLLQPPEDAEELTDAPTVSQWAYRQKGWRQKAAIGGLFAAGGFLLYVTAHPFLESMLAVAALLGVSQFVLVQWVAPFLSEFPEKVSAFLWARRVTHAPMALMNMVSSNINQWTVLAAMIPLVFGYSHYHHTGTWADFQFDHAQRLEIILTLLQSALAMVVLFNMEFNWRDATGLFALWAIQFFVPDVRLEVSIAYAMWIVVLLVGFAIYRRPVLAVQYAARAIHKKRPAGST